MPQERLNSTLNIRMSDSEKQRLDQAAKVLKVPASRLARHFILKSLTNKKKA